MSTRIRLARTGAKKKPSYRVVIADKRSARDGRFIEIVGRYNPRTKPVTLELDLERIDSWLEKGATPSERVEKLISIARDPEARAPETAKDQRPSKKAAEKAAEEEKRAAEPEAAAEAEVPAETETPAQDEALAEDEAPVEDEAPAENEGGEEASEEADDASADSDDESE